MKPEELRLTFGPDHPAWTAIDDDDWNGATFGNLLNHLKPGTVVTLMPGDKHPPELVARMKECVERFATVRVLKGAVCPRTKLPHVWMESGEPFKYTCRDCEAPMPSDSV
jgi:hypothetical protein